eukprot:161189-Rhodomonas_salina.2
MEHLTNNLVRVFTVGCCVDSAGPIRHGFGRLLGFASWRETLGPDVAARVPERDQPPLSDHPALDGQRRKGKQRRASESETRDAKRETRNAKCQVRSAKCETRDGIWRSGVCVVGPCYVANGEGVCIGAYCTVK